MKHAFLLPVLFVSLALGACGCKSKTVTIDGQQVTKSEAEEGMKEVAIMAKGVTPGSTAGLNLDYEPKTVVGKKMKTLLIEAKQIETDAEKRLAGIDATQLLTAQRLTTAAGRTKSREEVKVLQASDKETMERMTAYIAKVTELTNAFGTKPDSVEKLQEENETIQKKGDEMFAIFFQLLDLTDQAKPTLDGGSGQMLFAKDADLNRYNELLKQLQDKSTDFETTRNKIMSARAVRFSESMNVLTKE